MRSVWYAAFIALGVAILGSCGSDDPMTCTTPDRCCTANGVMTPRCGSCITGEVAVGLDRCTSTPTDGGTATCGDGMFTPAKEQCDPSAAAGCAVNETCTQCQCVPANDVCGDGMVTGGEGCELNRDCTSSPDLVCRRCQCAFKSARAIFEDTPGDTPMTTQGFAISSVGLELDGGADDTVVFFVVDVNGVQADMPAEVCLVINLPQSRTQRLCYQKYEGMPREATFTGEDGQKRVLSAAEAAVTMVAGPGFLVRYDTAIGLRTEPELDFYVESRYADMRTDVLPDTGTISFTEIFGR